MMYSQAQTFSQLSTRVAQTGLLNAFFEYAHYLPETAFVTLGLCVRILQAEALGPAVDDHKLPNMWWAIVHVLQFRQKRLEKRHIVQVDESLFNKLQTGYGGDELSARSNPEDIIQTHRDSRSNTSHAASVGEFLGAMAIDDDGYHAGDVMVDGRITCGVYLGLKG